MSNGAATAGSNRLVDSDADLDPSSYSLEKFTLYETRAVCTSFFLCNFFVVVVVVGFLFSNATIFLFSRYFLSFASELSVLCIDVNLFQGIQSYFQYL